VTPAERIPGQDDPAHHGGRRSAGDIKDGKPAYIAADNRSAAAIIINVVVPASPKDTDATTSAAAILNRVKSDNVLGIFCSNEGTARAVLTATNDGSALATQYAGLVVIGFDAGQAQKAAVKNKYFFGAITQDPYQIGFKAVELPTRGEGEKVSDGHGRKFYDSTNMDEKDIAFCCTTEKLRGYVDPAAPSPRTSVIYIDP
jgi:ribose transport system substrate-binding protein